MNVTVITIQVTFKNMVVSLETEEAFILNHLVLYHVNVDCIVKKAASLIYILDNIYMNL